MKSRPSIAASGLVRQHCSRRQDGRELILDLSMDMFDQVADPALMEPGGIMRDAGGRDPHIQQCTDNTL
eukprot:12897750-Prorocentrum_lima.AAC.1